MSDPLQPTAEQSAARTALPPDAPVVMVNLLQFKKPDGVQHYLRYGQEVAPLLKQAGATVRYAGFTQQLIVGDHGRPW